ncbi:ankyrin, putative [Plasmodium ovale]|uniref:Ankyrin, putative n=1 Tax=Plasmodium ovale TaxID=36330 RepID=A0A1D3TMJ0_PLAOA|nr:ankyrin, putative [Plasmodium ovale]
MFKRDTPLLQRKENKWKHSHGLRKVSAQLKVVRHFQWTHNNKVKCISIKFLYKKICKSKSFSLIKIYGLSLFFKKCMNKILYDDIAKIKMSYLNNVSCYQLFRIVNIKTQRSNQLTMLIKKIGRYVLEGVIYQKYIYPHKIYNSKENKCLLLGLMKMLLYYHERGEKWSQLRNELERKKEIKGFQHSNEEGNENRDFVISYCHEELFGRVSTNWGHYSQLGKREKKKKCENRDISVERNFTCSGDRKTFKHFTERSNVACTSKHVDCIFFSKYMGTHFPSSIKVKRGKKEPEEEQLYNGNICLEFRNGANESNKNMEKKILKNDKFHQKHCEYSEEKKEINLLIDEGKMNVTYIVRNPHENNITNVVDRRKMFKKRRIKNLICLNHVQIRNFNCGTCQFVNSVNTIYNQVKHVTPKTECRNNRREKGPNRGTNKSSFANFRKWKSSGTYQKWGNGKEKDSARETAAGDGNFTVDKDARRERSILKFSRKGAPSMEASNGEPTNGTVSCTKVLLSQHRINGKEGMRCVYRNVENESNASTEHETVEACLINFLTNGATSNVTSNVTSNESSNSTSNESSNSTSNESSNSTSNERSNAINNVSSSDISNAISNYISNNIRNGSSNGINSGSSNGINNDISNAISNYISNDISNYISNDISNYISNDNSNDISNDIRNAISNDISNDIRNAISNYVSNYISNDSNNRRSSGRSNGSSNGRSYSDLDAYVSEYRERFENYAGFDRMSDLQPIHLATKEGNIELIKKILISGTYINSKTRVRKFTPLHLSASKGDIDSVKFLIDNNADINALSSDNETPLWCASISNHLEVCKYILEKGAILNFSGNKKYDTPLHAASMMGNFEIVKLLIDNGADITCLDLNWLEPVHYASFEGHKGIVKYIIYKQIELALKKKMEKITQVMKQYNVYTKNLEMYYYFKYKSIVKKRITSKILCCAITSGNYKIVDLILKKGADPNYFDVRLQLFPIHAASIIGNIKIFKRLVKKGANVFMKTTCNNLPEDLTEDNEIKKFLANHTRKIYLRNAWIIRLRKKNHIISRLSHDTFYHLCTFF